MLKTQTTFSPLECGLCKESDCLYRYSYNELYRAGQKIAIKNCKRLTQKRRLDEKDA